MNLRPIFYIAIAALLVFLLLKCAKNNKPVIIEKITTRTVIDSIKYPEYIEIERPVVVTKERKIYLTDRKKIDSLISYYETELQSCARNYQEVLDQLYVSHAGDTIVDEREMKLYAGEKRGENYKLSWQIGAFGELHHFHPTIEVSSTTKIIDATKKHALGLHLGAFADTKMNFDPAIGVGYEKSWLGVNAVVVPNQKAVLLTFSPKIRW